MIFFTANRRMYDFLKIEISVSIFIITHFSERNKYSILLWVVIGTYIVFCQILSRFRKYIDMPLISITLVWIKSCLPYPKSKASIRGIILSYNFITFQDVIVSREKSIQYFLIIFSNITSSHVHLFYHYSKISLNTVHTASKVPASS